MLLQKYLTTYSDHIAYATGSVADLPATLPNFGI